MIFAWSRRVTCFALFSLIQLTAIVFLVHFDMLIPNIAFAFKNNEVLLNRIAIECFRLSRIFLVFPPPSRLLSTRHQTRYELKI